jgi:opacity protein-like surface antigen
MKFSLLFFLFITFFGYNSYSQDLDETKLQTTGDFESNVSFGNASLRINQIKSVGYYYRFHIKQEFAVNKTISVLSGLEYNQVETTANNFNFQNKFIGIPLSLRIGTTKLKSNIFFEFGGYVNQIINLESYDNIFFVTQSEKNSGTNFGYFAKLGLKYPLSDNLKFNINFCTGKDFTNSVRSARSDIEIENQIGLEVGLSLKL